MSITDLVRSKDGSLSLTKLAASTCHFSLACWVSWTTYTKGFDTNIWTLYLAAAIGHASFDKTTAMVSAYKTKQLQEPLDADQRAP